VTRWEKIYAVVRRIPRGKVASYGQVAEEAGLGRGHARQVGYALHALGEGDRGVPWHRVVNRLGEVSHGSEPDHQRVRLMEEGVRFDARDRVPRDRFVDWT
jgi:methylated-DNA-protein-cysteine methyltransferase-like protein